MTDPLDLDAIETEARRGYPAIAEVLALVAELRTARAERDEARVEASKAMNRIKAARAALPGVVVYDDHVAGRRVLERTFDEILAALSGATEPAGESLGKFKARRPS